MKKLGALVAVLAFCTAGACGGGDKKDDPKVSSPGDTTTSAAATGSSSPSAKSSTDVCNLLTLDEAADMAKFAGESDLGPVTQTKAEAAVKDKDGLAGFKGCSWLYADGFPAVFVRTATVADKAAADASFAKAVADGGHELSGIGDRALWLYDTRGVIAAQALVGSTYVRAECGSGSPDPAALQARADKCAIAALKAAISQLP